MTTVAVPAARGLPRLSDVRRERARRSLSYFERLAWPYVDPSPFVGGWHLDAICEALEAVTLGATGQPGGIRRLVINVPPRTGKSTTTSVCWPVWSWIDHPELRWLFTSYAERLAVRDARKSRQLIRSPWFQEQWGGRFRLLQDQNEKSRYENDKGGYRLSASFGGSATGEGGDIVVADDPHKALEAMTSDKERESVIEEWDTTYSTRLNDPETGALVIIMQRLHEKDLTGHVLEQGGYWHLCLPMEYEPKHPYLSPEDPRKLSGELLQPERFSRDAVTDLKRRLGSMGTAGQLQQNPSPAEGGMFKRSYWRFWLPGKAEPCPSCETQGWVEGVHPATGEEALIACPRCHGKGQLGFFPQVQEKITSWDMTFKDTKGTDYVVGQVWGRRGADRLLLDQVRDRLSFTNTVKAMRLLAYTWPDATAHLVEDSANGPAVIDTLKQEIAGLIPVTVKGSKVARAYSVTPQVEAGNVYLPHPSVAPWVADYIEEHARFDRGENDDQVDATSQALNRFGTVVTSAGVTKDKLWD